VMAVVEDLTDAATCALGDFSGALSGTYADVFSGDCCALADGIHREIEFCNSLGTKLLRNSMLEPSSSLVRFSDLPTNRELRSWTDCRPHFMIRTMNVAVVAK
jgi:hypothetical protein